MHVINSPHCRHGIAKYVTGTTRKRISRKNLGKVQIPLPPLAEQKRIAGILDAADALRAKRRQSLAQLDTLLQSTFADMFGDPATNPMGWERLAISEAVADGDVFTDGDWVESKDQDPVGDVRLTQLADVGDGTWLNKSARFLTSDKAKELGCTYLREGDLLVARMPDPLGRCCVFPGDPMPCVTVVDVCVVRPNPRTVNNLYLMHVINSPHCRPGIAKYVTGTTRKRISRKNLGKVQIPLPPLGVQHSFAAIVESVEEQKARQRDHLAKLDALFASLQCRAFRGDL
jgi:restriction endonuclease S subunit